MKFLIAEDDTDTLELASTCLRDRWPAAEIVGVGDGEEALQAVQMGSFDAIILDIGLPGMDGWEVLQRLRAFSDVPVVIVTGQNRETDVATFVKGSADTYVAKPFTQAALVESVETALKVSRS